jgi:hypothetical protein
VSRRPSSGYVDSVVSISSPRTTCANHEPSRAQCFRRGPLLNTKEEDRFVMLSRYINVGARVGWLGAQRGSWRSTAGIQLLRQSCRSSRAGAQSRAAARNRSRCRPSKPRREQPRRT